MDFLRRLHPGHADSAAAARLARAPHWATAAEALREAAPSPLPPPAADESRVGHADADAASALRAVGAAPQRPSEASRPSEPSPAGAAVTVAVAAPRRFDDTPSRLPEPSLATRGTQPLAHRPAQAIAPARDAVAASAPTRPERAKATHQSAAATTPAKPTASTRPTPEPSAPLRAQTVQQARHTPKADAAPVVHVTIDRIDVRLPSLASGAMATRKPRPTSTVAPLADYLRTRNGAGR